MTSKDKIKEYFKYLNAKPKGAIDFYNLKNILKEDCIYNMIVGERSNGKTYACLEYALFMYCKYGDCVAYVRRMDEDLRGKRGATIFDNHVANGLVKELTGGKWDNIYYYSQRWFLCKYDKTGKRIVDNKPFCYGFSISGAEHDKSSAYPDITTIIFDEFLTRTSYLVDEFVRFTNVISTIIRHRDNVNIFMLGNTVNQYSPYFTEMGIETVKGMKQGTIRVYNYGNSGLKVAVEYATSLKSQKENNRYFAFNNPKLEMITGGAWELDLYPHCPIKYTPKDIIFTYFIEFVDDVLQCEIIQKDDMIFTFVHRKTTPIKDLDNDLIFTQEYSPKPNYRRNLIKPTDTIGNKLAWFFKTDKVFYQDNMIGEIMRNYLLWCKQN